MEIQKSKRTREEPDAFKKSVAKEVETEPEPIAEGDSVPLEGVKGDSVPLPKQRGRKKGAPKTEKQMRSDELLRERNKKNHELARNKKSYDEKLDTLMKKIETLTGGAKEQGGRAPLTKVVYEEETDDEEEEEEVVVVKKKPKKKLAPKKPKRRVVYEEETDDEEPPETQQYQQYITFI